MLLAGEVRAVAYPDGQRPGAERLANPQAFEVVVDCLVADPRVGVGQAAELVRVRLPRLVFEGVRVDRCQRQATAGRQRLERGRVVRAVPGYVPGDLRCDAR